MAHLGPEVYRTWLQGNGAINELLRVANTGRWLDATRALV